MSFDSTILEEFIVINIRYLQAQYILLGYNDHLEYLYLLLSSLVYLCSTTSRHNQSPNTFTDRHRQNCIDTFSDWYISSKLQAWKRFLHSYFCLADLDMKINSNRIINMKTLEHLPERVWYLSHLQYKKAGILNRQFQSVVTKEMTQLCPKFMVKTYHP